MPGGIRLAGRRILLGVTGSIAAYKAAEVLRRLQDEGAQVRVAMTRNAMRFVGPMTFAALSGQAVLTDDHWTAEGSRIEHVASTDDIDLALVAPATANCIGKIAAGIADDALSSALMACDCSLVIVPAMNERMYRNPSLVRNLAVLRAQGTTIVEPESGRLACGTEGIGRFADPDTIIAAVTSVLAPGDLAGVNILVTAGPTREPIDAVRFLSNPSTGRMGYAIARSARNHGAQVILISGPTQLEPPDGVIVVPVATASEMKQAVNDHTERCSVIIMAAAVSDFRPVSAYDRKVKKEDAALTVELERTEDILQELGNKEGKRILVGFAAETDALTQNALLKLKKKNLDMIVANDVRRKDAGFGSVMNAVTIIDRSGTATELPLMQKDAIAELIIQKVAQLAAKQRISP